MTKLLEILTFFESIAPLRLQESYDNAGLIVGDPEMEVKAVLTCLDSTEAVVDEAIAMDCNVVLAHHPIVFRGLKQFTPSTYVQRVIRKAIKNDIAIIAMHTNLDNVYQNGVNERIAKKLGLKELAFLKPKENEEDQAGSGMIGEMQVPMDSLDFLQFLKREMQVKCVKYTEITCRQIKKVAVCGGAGGFLLKDAIKANADIFITADYKYHEFFDADQRIIIADIGHFESEQFTIDLLCELINDNFINFAAHCTKVYTNPVNYL